MRCIVFVAACLLGLSGPALAQDFIEGVWLSNPEGCAAAQSTGLSSALEDGSLALTAAGLHGFEYHCDFLQVLKGTRTQAWTVIALCEEPGFAFSDLITVTPRSEGQVELTSIALRPNDEEAPGSVETYTLCEGVEQP